MAAQAMPPRTPASSINGKAQPPSDEVNNAMPDPAMAPMVSWPSAPMFQTFARKPMANPNAHNISGVAFKANSPRPYTEDSGSTKNTLKPTQGLLPNIVNKMKPVSSMAAAASNGAPICIGSD